MLDHMAVDHTAAFWSSTCDSVSLKRVIGSKAILRPYLLQNALSPVLKAAITLYADYVFVWQCDIIIVIFELCTFSCIDYTCLSLCKLLIFRVNGATSSQLPVFVTASAFKYTICDAYTKTGPHNRRSEPRKQNKIVTG